MTELVTPPEWRDLNWWQEQLSCVRIADPVLCNHRITLAHYDLSRALAATIGSSAGANFHTWAVWGSWKAGTTIRQQDIPGLRIGTTSLGSILGASIGTVVGRQYAHRRVVGIASALVGVLTARSVTNRLLRRASEKVLEGNRLVLEDIGAVTARYLSTLGTLPRSDPKRLSEFLHSLRPGSTDRGGQDLLRQAFANYDAARWENDQNRQHEYMLLANLQAIQHEHMQLEPYIDAAVPRPLRSAVTARLLTFQVGPSQLSVSADVPSVGERPYPPALNQLENPDLLHILHGQDGWDLTPNDLRGSRVHDWTKFRQRMNYISDLFRSRHLDPSVFACPFTDGESAWIRRGVVPQIG